MITNFVGISLTLTLVLLLNSCSSKDPRLSKSPENKVVQVEEINKKVLHEKGFDDKTVDQAILNSGFATKKKWFKVKEDHADFKKMQSKSVSELKSLLSQGDAAQTTLIIEVLSHKGATAVSTLVDLLNDKRTAVFKEQDKIYWYEEKNKPPQEIEIRIFAAMHLERMVATSPYGVKFDFHKIQTDKGPVEVLYAVKGSYAVNKDDVCKNWLKWWSVYGGDYK